jgi:hypothetical protein
VPDNPSPGDLTLAWDGRDLTGRSGQSIAAVLLANGVRSWRAAPVTGRPRGIFCGMGICFDCLVSVNGVEDVRACTRVARPGDVVAPQGGAAPGPAAETEASR